MNRFILNEESNSIQITNLIEVCKSSSLIIGKELRQAHYALGKIIAPELIKNSYNKDFAILVMMRAGFFFACGIADKIEDLSCLSKLILIDDTIKTEDLPYLNNKEVIIVDAVINTGASILQLIEQLPNTIQSIKIATTVIPKTSLKLSLFDKYKLYTVRASENKYVGDKVLVHSLVGVCGKSPDGASL